METLTGPPPALNTLLIILWYDNGVGDNGMYVCVRVLVFHRVKHEFCYHLSRVFFFFLSTQA